MRATILGVAAATLLLALSGPAQGATVLAFSGNLSSSPWSLGNEVIEQGWHVDSTWQNVAIRIFVQGWAGNNSEVDGAVSETFGPGSVTYFSNTVIQNMDTPGWVTLFSGLTLAPGDYHLTINGSNSGIFNFQNPTVSSGPGVTVGDTMIGTIVNSADIAASEGWVGPWPIPPALEIAGDLSGSAAAPEPRTLPLAGGAFIVLAGACRRRRRA